MSEFKREPRYIVFKIKDLERYQINTERLHDIGNIIACGRKEDGKPPFNAVVVEQDWPEFDVVWDLIEERMKKESP